MSDFESEPPSCCSSSSEVESTELKLYQAFIFSVPIFFTFVLLFVFYLFYLRRRSVDWDSLRMRSSSRDNNNDILRAELGLKKELREMLPIVIYRESFSVRETQCPVCLGDYQADERLQQIPACGHAFHMDCIDHWLANHTTCPLCRQSLLASAKVPIETHSTTTIIENAQESSAAWNIDENPAQSMPQPCEESIAVAAEFSQSSTLQDNCEEGERKSECTEDGRELRDARDEVEEHGNNRGFSA